MIIIHRTHIIPHIMMHRYKKVIKILKKLQYQSSLGGRVIQRDMLWWLGKLVPDSVIWELLEGTRPAGRGQVTKQFTELCGSGLD